MLSLLFAIAAGGVNYYPPTSDDATRAVARHIADFRYNDTADAFGGNYPVDIQLERCDADDARAVRNEHGIWQVFSGYACVMTVSFADEPAYKVEGFYHFDGIDWAYYGPIRPPLVVEPDSFERYRKGSTQTAKPGSILYSGHAGDSLMANPYDRVLRGSDAFIEPAEQPYRADIYSTDQ